MSRPLPEPREPGNRIRAHLDRIERGLQLAMLIGCERCGRRVFATDEAWPLPGAQIVIHGDGRRTVMCGQCAANVLQISE